MYSDTPHPPPLPRHCLRANTPAIPAGHWQHKTEPNAIGTFATLAYDPTQPRHVQIAHFRLLHASLATLAGMVKSISTGTK